MFNEAAKTTLSSHCDDLDHSIELLLKTTPLFKLLYNLSEHKLKVLKAYINKNLESEFIIYSKSLAKALILFIKKKDNSLRLCVNYQSLNKISIKNKYLIPLIFKILN